MAEQEGNTNVLLRLRKEVKATQFRVAELAGITSNWYRILEQNQNTPTRYTTARNLLKAFNTLRGEKRLAPLENLDQLKLNIK